jgi:hypothetical protein
MKCKKIYLGQKITQDDWDYGIGSIYLAGPRPPQGKSWRLDAIKKIEDTKSPTCILIPETKDQLKNGHNKQQLTKQFEWQRLAMSVASSILFWYPAKIADPHWQHNDHRTYITQSYAEFGAWHKVERVFLGRENPGSEYLDWLLLTEQKLYPAENLDQLVEMVIHWLRE